MLSDRRALVVPRLVEMAVHDQFDMLEAHIGAAPILGVALRSRIAFRAVGRSEGRLGREMCLAEEARVVSRLRQGTGETGLADLRVEIDSVIGNAVGIGQQTGQHRRPRRLAKDARRDAG